MCFLLVQVVPHNSGELPDEVTLKDYESERILPVAQFGAGIETRDYLALSATLLEIGITERETL